MGKFEFTETGLRGMCIVETARFGDARGYFMETYNQNDFVAAGHPYVFVQDNQSMSRKGVLRGLHFQINNPQGKLVRVISGAVFDVGVDIRRDSPTFGQWHGEILSAENGRQLYVPEGFAHGVLVLSETAEFVYKCTRFYDPSDEGGIAWDDPAIGIKWPDLGMAYILSEKDRNNRTLADYIRARG